MKNKKKDKSHAKQKVYSWDKDPFAIQLGIDIDVNKIGTSGEAYFQGLFSWFGMTVAFLGEKAPYVDCLVTFEYKRSMYEFLVQVKTTKDIKAEVIDKTVSSGITREQYTKLRKYHLPTYVARVDMKEHVIYIKGAFQTANKTHYSRIPTKYKLSYQLFEETKDIITKNIATDVYKYWMKALKKSYKNNYQSYFSDEQ